MQTPTPLTVTTGSPFSSVASSQGKQISDPSRNTHCIKRQTSGIRFTAAQIMILPNNRTSMVQITTLLFQQLITVRTPPQIRPWSLRAEPSTSTHTGGKLRADRQRWNPSSMKTISGSRDKVLSHVFVLRSCVYSRSLQQIVFRTNVIVSSSNYGSSHSDRTPNY